MPRRQEAELEANRRIRAFHPPLHAKEVQIDGSRRSPGLRVRMSDTRISPPAFPGFPSGRGQFPRLQLRGSAGFAPASLSLPSGKDARSERHFKEPERNVGMNLSGVARGSQLENLFVLTGRKRASSMVSRRRRSPHKSFHDSASPAVHNIHHKSEDDTQQK